MGYGRYLVFRIGNAIFVLILVVLITSTIFNSAIERVLKAQIEEELDAIVRSPEYRNFTPEQIENLKATLRKTRYVELGFDQPYWIRVFYRAFDALTLNFGRAAVLFGKKPVLGIILERLPRTILLFTTAHIIYIVIGILLGLKAARGVGGLFDRATSLIAMISVSLPMWWFGMLMILMFAYKLPWFPSSLMVSVPPPQNPLAYIADVLYHMALPLATIVLVSFGSWAYSTRNIVIGTLQQDFVTAARAKGLPERKVIYGHVLRAASPPLVTMSILSLTFSLGGAIITETIFSWPGMGNLYWTALQAGDVPILLGNTFMLTFIYLIALVLIDMIYGFLDPRVRVGISARGK
jgi:peptide/nickel transport system permease protein